MPIQSQEQLRGYIQEVLGYDPQRATRFANSAMFSPDGRFRGGGVDFLLFFDELGGGQIRRLLREFNNPQIIWDCYPSDNGCVERPNCCCAHYTGLHG
jgi:hypothetical protein